MSMSRKQYRDISGVMKDAWGEKFDPGCSGAYVQGWILSYVASGLAAVFKADNPRFDHDRFMAACFPQAVINQNE